jgi:cytochrome c-type biogenesis protein CcmH
VRRETLKIKFAVLFFALLASALVAPSLSAATKAPDLDEQARVISAELRCPVCQNLSVADSPSELAQEMRALVREQLEQGKSPEEIKKYFVSKYGDWVLLAPPAKGFGLLLWVLPAIGALAGIILVVVVTRRWVGRGRAAQPAMAASPGAAVAPMTTAPPPDVPMDKAGQRQFYEQERARLEAEEKEIEFDFQSGKLSEADYTAMRARLDSETAAIGQRLANLPPPSPAPASRKVAAEKKVAATAGGRTWKNWQLAAGAFFLLLLGIGLGVLLMRATRQREGEQASITGDFLTGTDSSGNPDALLAQGRAAFEKRDWGRAIEAFKKVLAIDPKNPEAHAYMGLMLVQAGHNEGAMSSFDRALAEDPNFPVALWGKGMLLAQTGGDPAEARRLLEKVSQMMQPGPEKVEVEKAIAGLGKPGAVTKTEAPAKTTEAATKKPPPAPEQAAAAAIQGVIDIDSKSKGSTDPQSVLFIIAKTTSGAGPPLAVKKIPGPKFPLTYSVGPEDVMMPGSVFSGKLFISARLDKDGNIATKQPGDFAGEYKKNPVDAGAKKIDFTLEPAK